MSEQHKTDALIRRMAREEGLRVQLRHKDWPADKVTEVDLYVPGTTYKSTITVYADQTERQIAAAVRTAIARLLLSANGGG